MSADYETTRSARRVQASGVEKREDEASRLAMVLPEPVSPVQSSQSFEVKLAAKQERDRRRVREAEETVAAYIDRCHRQEIVQCRAFFHEATKACLYMLLSFAAMSHPEGEKIQERLDQIPLGLFFLKEIERGRLRDNGKRVCLIEMAYASNMLRNDKPYYMSLREYNRRVSIVERIWRRYINMFPDECTRPIKIAL